MLPNDRQQREDSLLVVLHNPNLKSEVAGKHSHGPEPQQRSSHCSDGIKDLRT